MCPSRGAGGGMVRLFWMASVVFASDLGSMPGMCLSDGSTGRMEVIVIYPDKHSPHSA